MKTKVLLTVNLLLISLLLSAQITLTEEDLPEIGDVTSFCAAEVTPGITIGNAGANQTWDFSGLTPTDTFNTTFIALSESPGESLFPDADMVSVTDEVYGYQQVTNDALYILGLSVDTTGMGDFFHIEYDPAAKGFEIPTTYGTNFTTESGYSWLMIEDTDTVRVVHRTVDEVEFDGYGTVLTPLGSFDALRSKVISTNYDSVQVSFSGMWITISSTTNTSTNYSWYTNGSKGNLVNILYDDGVVAITYQIYEQTVIAPDAAFNWEDEGNGLISFSDMSTNEPTSWEWDFDDGSTSTEQNPQHTYGASGTYNVCLTASNSAGANTACQDIQVTITSTDKVSNQLQLSVFPNPSTGYLSILLKGAQTQDLRVSLTDPFGKICKQIWVVSNGNDQIDLSGLSPGVYFLRLQDRHGQVLKTEKVLIQ